MVHFVVSLSRETSQQGCSTSYSEPFQFDRSHKVEAAGALLFELISPSAQSTCRSPQRIRGGLFAAIGLDVPRSGGGSQSSGKLVLGVSLLTLDDHGQQVKRNTLLHIAWHCRSLARLMTTWNSFLLEAAMGVANNALCGMAKPSRS